MPIYTVVDDPDNPEPMQHPGITLVDHDGGPYNPATSIPDGTYVPFGRPPVAGAFTALMAALDDGQQSAAFLALTDSTGAGTDSWPRRLGTALAAAFPTYGCEAIGWVDGSQSYGFPATQLVAPPLGRRHLQCGANTARHPGDGTALVDLDAEFDIDLPAWPPSAQMAVGGRYGGAGQIGFVLYLNTAGTLQLNYSQDGTAVVFCGASGVIPSPGANTRFKVKVTLDVNNGSGGNTLTYFYSTDNGATWVTLTGGGVNSGFAGVATLHNPSTFEYELGGRNGGAAPFLGKIYETRISGVIGSQDSVVSRHPDNWIPSGAGVTIGGSPMLTVVSGGVGGASVTYLNDATRCPKMCLTGYHTLAVILSCSHNDQGRRGPTYLADWDTWLTRIRTKLPYAALAVSTQNRRVSPATWINEHRFRQDDIRMWAAKNSASLIDAHRAFDESPLSSAQLIQGDGIHPTSAVGQVLWNDTALAVAMARS